MNTRLLPGLFLTCFLIMPGMAQKQESHGIAGLGNEKERLPATGCRLFQKALNAIANPVTLGTIRSRRWKGSVRTFSDAASYSYQLEKVIVYPDKIYQAIRAADASVSHMVVTPNFSYVGVGDGGSDLPRATVEGMQNGIKMDPIYIAQHWSNYSCAPEGTELIGHVSAVNVRITGENVKIQWSIDPSTGHVLRTRTHPPSGGEIVTDYSDYHLVAGTPVAFEMHTAENGSTADITITEYELNPTLDPKLFELPSPSSQSAQLEQKITEGKKEGSTTIFGITMDKPLPNFPLCQELLPHEQEPPCRIGAIRGVLKIATTKAEFIYYEEDKAGNVELVKALFASPSCPDARELLEREFGKPTYQQSKTQASGAEANLTEWMRNDVEVLWRSPFEKLDCGIAVFTSKWRPQQDSSLSSGQKRLEVARAETTTKIPRTPISSKPSRSASSPRTDSDDIRTGKYEDILKSGKALKAGLSVGVNYSEFGDLVRKFATEYEMLPEPRGAKEVRLKELFGEALAIYKDSLVLWGHKIQDEKYDWGGAVVSIDGHVYPDLEEIMARYDFLNQPPIYRPSPNSGKIMVLIVDLANQVLWSQATKKVSDANAMLE